MMDFVASVLKSFEWFGGVRVELLSVDWLGGGQNYEYRVIFADGRIVQSGDEFGSASAAVAAAFLLLVDECL